MTMTQHLLSLLLAVLVTISVVMFVFDLLEVTFGPWADRFNEWLERRFRL
jgi:hypothetical protein